MGKKGSGWFSMVKKVFKSSSKDLPDKKVDLIALWSTKQVQQHRKEEKQRGFC
ncbi:hypothetical protein F383_34989 [Gossypium arboreum]|uniref:Uncharacterized protein n=1 Tax=Gossypium arboreum TaxID=29729 RepID=A0A0B0PTB0_GOSAR|nr:hypothetical protein F383_34989 [Gossypium arboreum]